GREPPPLNGTAAQKAVLGTASTASGLGLAESRSMSALVQAVEARFVPTFLGQSSVPRSVGNGISGRSAGIGSRFVAAVETCFGSGMAGRRIAPVHVLGLRAAPNADVYDLTVEGAHEFFADGHLVHNCDAMVWALTDLMLVRIRMPD